MSTHPSPAPVRRSSVGRGTMVRSAALAAGGCLAATSLVLPATAATASTATLGRHAAAQHLVANLHGGMQGDPNGSGRAEITLNKKAGKVCAQVTWRRIQKPDAAHIHRPDGQIVVDLTGSVTGGTHCTTHVGKKLIGKILRHPRHYYLNVHNKTYPAGAISGKLHR